MTISVKRKEKNLTQEELADTLYVSSKTVSKWENGRGFPSVESLKPLTEALGISLNELLMGKDIKEDEKEESFNNTIINFLKDKKRKKISLFIITLIEFILMLVLFTYLYAKGYGDEVAIPVLIFVVIAAFLTELETKIKL